MPSPAAAKTHQAPEPEPKPKPPSPVAFTSLPDYVDDRPVCELGRDARVTLGLDKNTNPAQYAELAANLPAAYFLLGKVTTDGVDTVGYAAQPIVIDRTAPKLGQTQLRFDNVTRPARLS